MKMPNVNEPLSSDLGRRALLIYILESPYL